MCCSLVCIVALVFAPLSAADAARGHNLKGDNLDWAIAGEVSLDESKPLQKVMELLSVLSKEISAEGKEDAKTYELRTQHYNKEEKQIKAIIKKQGDNIAQLESDLKEAQAFRDGKNKDLGDLANKLGKNENQLSSGQSERKIERAAFEKAEATFVGSIDQLDRALTVMKKKMPGAAAASSASLVSVAQKLKKALTQGGDFKLNTAQRETLNSFVRTASLAAGSSSSHEAEDNLPAPSFLQLRAGQRGPYGQFNSNSGGLVSTLEDLRKSVHLERNDGLKKEKKGKEEFADWESSLSTMIENAKKSLADLKSSIAQSQQQSSQKEASLLESKEIYKTEVPHMEEVETEFRVRTQAYKIRLGKRADEAIAVHEARRMLSSDLSKEFIKQASLPGGKFKWGQGSSSKAASFLQLSWSPGVSLLAIRSKVHRGRVAESRTSRDPFKKVKSMLKGMLQKLKAKQAQESEHAAWCDHEMGKSTKEQTRKEDGVQKLKDRLEALSSDLTTTTADIASVSKDLKDMKESMADASSLRNKEHKHAVSAMRQYLAAVKMLKRARKVLKEQYDHKAKAVSRKVDKFGRQGLGSGVIGILEIAIDDYKKLYYDTKDDEDASAKDFKTLRDESAVRAAVFEKDLEWKSRTKVKLELDQSTMKNDLKSYQNELSAIDTYIGKLKASCIVKGPSYAEKKAKRASELSSLKDAYKFLKSSR